MRQRENQNIIRTEKLIIWGWLVIIIYILIRNFFSVPFMLGDEGRDLLVSRIINEENVNLNVGHFMMGLRFRYPPNYFNLLAFTGKVVGNGVPILKVWGALCFLSFVLSLWWLKKISKLDFSVWLFTLSIVMVSMVNFAGVQSLKVAWTFYNVGFMLIQMAIFNRGKTYKKYLMLFFSSLAIAFSCSIHMSFVTLLPVTLLLIYIRVKKSDFWWFLLGLILFEYLFYYKLINYFGDYILFKEATLNNVNVSVLINSATNIGKTFGYVWLAFVRFWGDSILAMLMMAITILSGSWYALFLILQMLSMIIIFSLFPHFISQEYYYYYPIAYFLAIFSIIDIKPRFRWGLRFCSLLFVALVFIEMVLGNKSQQILFLERSTYYDFSRIALYINNNYSNLPVIMINADNFCSIYGSKDLWQFLYDKNIYTLGDKYPEVWFRDDSKNFLLVCTEYIDKYTGNCQEYLKKFQLIPDSTMSVANKKVYFSLSNISIDSFLKADNTCLNRR